MNNPEDEYDFITPNRIVFGWGRRREAGVWAAKYGSQAVIICGSETLKKNGVVDQLKQTLLSAGVAVIYQGRTLGEPTVEQIDLCTAEISEALKKSEKPKNETVIVAIGGGAAIDTAKAVAAMVVNSTDNNSAGNSSSTEKDSTTESTAGNSTASEISTPESVRDYLEGVGTGKQITVPPLPVIAIPTTAGTGAEATYNAVISVSNPSVKKSLRHEGLMPKVALVDPELTVYCPPFVTAASGMDALTQLIESFISRKARPIPQSLALEGLGLVWKSLEIAVADGENRSAREQMAQGALLSGICLANSGLGMAHGVAASLGAHIHVAHGVACACMLPIAIEVNRQDAITELNAIAGFVLPESSNYGINRIDELINSIKTIAKNISMPDKLQLLGLQRSQIPEIARDSQGNSLNGNPKTLTQEELIQILERHF